MENIPDELRYAVSYVIDRLRTAYAGDGVFLEPGRRDTDNIVGFREHAWPFLDYVFSGPKKEVLGTVRYREPSAYIVLRRVERVAGRPPRGMVTLVHKGDTVIADTGVTEYTTLFPDLFFRNIQGEDLPRAGILPVE